VARVDDEEQPRGADRDGAPDSDWSGGAAWGERMLARSHLPFWYSNVASWVWASVMVLSPAMAPMAASMMLIAARPSFTASDSPL